MERATQMDCLNGSNNKKFLAILDEKAKTDILRHIAKVCGISPKEAYQEVTDDKAEHLLDYMEGTYRIAISAFMQAKGFKNSSF